jgi:Ca-activated chloride channel family protein
MSASIGFEHPFVLVLVLLAPLFVVLRKTGFLIPPALPLTMSDWNGNAFIWKSSASRFGIFLCRFFAVCAFLLVVAALAGPVVIKKEKVFTSRGTDIIFVLDTSPSMAARDMDRGNTLNAASSSGGNPYLAATRFDAAKEIIAALAQNDSGQPGLVTFASEAALSVPVTVDIDFFSSRLDKVRIGELGDGSGIGTGLALAVYHLASTGAQKKCAVLFTDGENNAGSIHPLTAARLAREHDITLYVVGLGTKGRVQLEYVDPKTGSVYSGYLDSQFDESTLRDLASEGGGLYFPAATFKDLELSLESVMSREQTSQTWYVRTDVKQFYDRFVFIAVLCVIAALFIKRLILRESL